MSYQIEINTIKAEYPRVFDGKSDRELEMGYEVCVFVATNDGVPSALFNTAVFYLYMDMFDSKNDNISKKKFRDLEIEYNGKDDSWKKKYEMIKYGTSDADNSLSYQGI